MITNKETKNNVHVVSTPTVFVWLGAMGMHSIIELAGLLGLSFCVQTWCSPKIIGHGMREWYMYTFIRNTRGI